MVNYLSMKKALLLMLFHASTFAYAQNTLSLSANLMQPGDSIVKERVAYVNAGLNGKNVVWDFSDIEPEDTYCIRYDSLSKTRLIGLDDKRIYKYSVEKDTLRITGYESPLLRIDYSQPPILLPSPMQYGQYTKTKYQGEGLYSGTHHERIIGTSEITVDGEGAIILSENDTLPNTLRVYTISTESIRLSADSCRNDSDNMKQIITEHYQWYARGYRYPVFETVTSSSYDKMNHVATQQYAYRFSPKNQKELNDTLNEQIREKDKLLAESNLARDGNGNNNSANDAGFTYDIDVHANEATITYSLEQHAQIHVLVVDVLGTIYHDTQQTREPGTDYTVKIDCSGLRHGQYIIYINVNGKIYTSKIPHK